MSAFGVGDKVRVPGRYNRLVVSHISAGIVRAVFESGSGWYEGPEHEFAADWRELPELAPKWSLYA